MAVFCITTSNPEFQKLLAESGEKQGVFAMMVSKWMTENEVYDRYPTLQELGISPMTSIKPGVAKLFDSKRSFADYSDFGKTLSEQEIINLKKEGNKITAKQFLESIIPVNDFEKKLKSFLLSIDLNKLNGFDFVINDKYQGNIIGLNERELFEKPTVIFNSKSTTEPSRYKLHEFLHSLLDTVINEEQEFRTELITLFDYVKTLPEFKNEYGVIGWWEFYTEGMTNPDFQAKLKNVTLSGYKGGKKSNVYEEFVKIINNILEKLGFVNKDYSALDEIINATTKVIEKRYGYSVKSGVSELFESNPELANAVYEALGFKGERTIETAKGSTYRYLPSGKTQRFKKVEGKEYEPQDILTFVPNYEWIKSNNPQWLEKQGLENDTQYTQYLLEKVQGKDKVWIVDSKGKKIETNQDAKTADRLFIAFGKKDGTVEDFIPVSKEPVIGFYTYDSRIHFDEKGERYRDRHLGNKVVKITEGITPQQKQQAQQLYSQYLDTTTNPTIEGFKLFVGNVGDVATDTGLDMSIDEARAFNSLVNDGTIPIKCE